MPKRIKLIVGLGNPGRDYADTYHNAGFIAVEYFREKLKAPPFKKTAWFEYSKADDLILLKPQVFMNRSGEAVKRALRFFKVKPDEMLVFHDDSDIAFGKIKFSLGRGAAGHRGVESIIKSLGSKDFWRGRIGVRNAASKGLKAGEFVLKKIPPRNRRRLYLLLQGVIEKVTEKDKP